MKLGVSLYPSLSKKEEWMAKLEQAKKYGFDLIFTSIQLDTLDFSGASSNWDVYVDFFNQCRKLNLDVSVDVSKDSIGKLGVKGFNLESVVPFGIKALRIDGGYTNQEIVKFTNNNFDIKIEINASMTHDLLGLLKLISNEGNIKNIIACHNFFPKKHTGLGIDRFNEYNKIIKSFDVKIGAFITTQNSSSKLCETSFGVPTLESHRYIDVKYQMEDYKNADIDYVIFSEEDFTDDELKEVSLSNTKHINIYLESSNINQTIKNKISCTNFTSRPDQPEYLIRFAERLGDIKPVENQNIKTLSFGMVTIDNNINGRYSGEINIYKNNIPFEKYYNFIGSIRKEQLNLLNTININKEIKLNFVK